MRSRTAISAASMVNQQKDSRKASVSVFPGREETCYINLDAPQTDQRETGVSAEMDTQRPDDFLPNVRIRGLEQEEPERAEDDYVSPEEASQNVQNHARESDEDVYIPWEEPEETVNQSIDLESEIRWYEDGQKEVTDSVMRKQEDTDDSVKPQRDASDFAVCKQEDTGSSVEPQRDASDFAVHKQEDNGSADAVRPAAEHVRQSAETSASKTPETRKSAASAWDGIWADETDVSRGGTSGTVFRDERRPGSSRSEKQMVSREDTDGDESQVQPAGSDSGGHIKKNPRSSQQEIEDGIASVEAEAAKAAEVVKPEYVFPPLDLLKKGKNKNNSSQEQEIRKTAAKLQQTLDSFGVRVTVTDVSCGPSVTRYELQPEQGVKVSRIVSLADDIKLNLAAADIRIEAPIPGKAAVGIEVPNAENSAVMLRDLLESEEFQNHPSHLAFATGKDIGGKPVVSDIAKMPHLLIAGATGSGKSVCINTLIMSILYKADPEDVKLIMIDPKVVELSVYNGIPHLFIPVVTDPKKAAGALNWGVAEMTDRYNKFAEFGVRNLKGYNEKIEAMGLTGEDAPKKLPQIVIIVDELADLMMVAPGEVEDSICRLAQLARAAGIHLIIATQRPSVNVITGLIKANMPSRIAFSVSSSVDSRTIIDMGGAEKLLGKGDMLFYPQGYQKPERVQGAFVSDEEVADVVDFLKNKNVSEAYSTEMEQQMAKVQQAVATSKMADDTDALFAEAGKFIIEKDKASIGMLQRVFKIGFNRAARIMDQLSDAGVVGPEEGTKPRKVLMTLEEFENTLE
jgi:DNA segregation ATPase FtsK/SpoIIIE-like protein